MFSSSIHRLPTVTSYEAAHERFEEEPKPRGKKWAEHQRPLADNAKHHYRLEKGTGLTFGDYYDVVLYRTSMARYYAPQADGSRVVLYMWHDAQMSKQFMWHVLHHSKRMECLATTGATVVVPMHGSQCVRIDGNSWTVKLRLDAAGKLDTFNSCHPQQYMLAATDADKARRKQLNADIQNVLLLSAMQLGRYEQERVLSYEGTGAFKGTPIPFAVAHALRRPVNSPAWIEAAMACGQFVYNALYSRRCAAAVGNLMPWEGDVFRRVKEDVEVPISEKDFIAALKRLLAKHADMDRRNGVIELPKFMPVGEFPAGATAYSGMREVITK